MLRRRLRGAMVAAVLGGGRVSQFTDIPAAESYALEDLYAATGGGSWTNKTGWDGATAADAFGVTVSGGRVTSVVLQSNNLVGSVATWQPGALSAATVIDLRGNAGLTGDISGWTLPASLETFSVSSTSVSGDISGWTLPASLVSFYVHSTSVSGAPDCSGAVKLTIYRYYNCGLNQATVDAILWSLYQASVAPRTATGGEINLGGTNAAPSGTFQAASACPVTDTTDGKEVAYELLNDGCGEGFNKWATVTITS